MAINTLADDLKKNYHSCGRLYTLEELVLILKSSEGSSKKSYFIEVDEENPCKYRIYYENLKK